MQHIFKKLEEDKAIKKVIYMLMAMGYAYYEVRQIREIFKKDSFREIAKPAIKRISYEMKVNMITEQEIAEFIYREEPYLGYLYFEAGYDISILIIMFIYRNGLNLLDIFLIPLEQITINADKRYRITKIENNYEVNHQGLYFEDFYYYYSPLFFVKRNAKNPPPLIESLVNLEKKGNDLWLRLDNSLRIKKEDYSPFYREFFEIYQGREINLDDIQFPFKKGEFEPFCVYNPKTMKKIQFKISHRKDSEKWIEAEELWPIKEDKKQDWYLTRYFHSIYDDQNHIFVHVDGSFNFYTQEQYKVRINQNINAHARFHQKMWLVEGEISIVDWGKLLLNFFDDPDLILDALKGNLVEEVFEDYK
ncbi:MAG: hypothetical protein C6W58_17905 [Bacillaceae bacterium]|nr:MAG: hypothetical protein C6W58_17905 [Bacillaceae bacterium]